MKKILTFTIITIVALGLSVQAASACNHEIPGCTDPEALNYNPEATVDDGSCEYNVYGCTDPAAINYNPEATINDGTCEYEGLKGSITVCKIITDSENNIINGSAFPGTEFSITVAEEVITFTTPLTLNRSFWGDCAHEGQCIIISGLDITEYFYSEETYPSEGWEIPLYNDQFDVQVKSLDDFFVFDLSNDNSDGHIVLTEQRPDRTLVILNKQKGGEDIYGCTDPEALNYDPAATIDDGSCIYDIPGCTDPAALNYNPDATIDDGSCIYEIPGCTDSEAANYNPEATVDDGSCIYGIPGCTDPSALNYNPDANVDDGSCIYDIPGCTDPVAINYNPEATVDDGSCEYEPPVIPGCTDPEALNYDPAATIDDGSCEYPELFSISGMKFNDQNDNGVNDTEPGLMGWTIELYVSEQIIDSTITDTYGNYSFLNLDPGTYTVCELPQVGGWVQTYPTDNNWCHIVELVDTDLLGYDFGNHYQGYPILGCTDPEALNYNLQATVDDGTCIYEIPGCTDSKALNYNPDATVNDGSCRYGGGSVRPRFSIIKTVAEEFVNAGQTANYTIVVECLGSGVARNTMLKDVLPQGFSYEDVSEDGEWELGDMIRGDKETVIFKVVVSEDAQAGNYVNTAEVQASNSNKYTDTAELEVRTIPVKGDEFFPELEIDKSVNKGSALAGTYVLFTIKVKNVGDAPAVNAVIRDTLPQGFIAEDGKSEVEWTISLLEEGETWEQSFSVYIQSDVADGRYENVVVASAENHVQEVEDIAVVVLGSLPHTGIKISDILKEWVKTGSLLVYSAPVATSFNYLVIPKIGVEIPIVQSSDDSALEKGAWLLPQTTTPDLFKNTALAAHRFKFKPPHKQTFYLLDKVSQGDDLLVYWKGEKYVYSVSSISIVNPSQTEVLADTDIPTLTLITCHPLFSDTSRLVVQGTLVI